MFLNNHPHFMAAKGCKSYDAAHRKIERIRKGLTQKPLMLIVSRSTLGKPDDFVPVVILPKDSLHNPLFYADLGIYVTSV